MKLILPSVHVGPVKEVRSQSHADEIQASWQTPRLEQVSGVQYDTTWGEPKVVKDRGYCKRLAIIFFPVSGRSSDPSKAASRIRWVSL